MPHALVGDFFVLMAQDLRSRRPTEVTEFVPHRCVRPVETSENRFHQQLYSEI